MNKDVFSPQALVGNLCLEKLNKETVFISTNFAQSLLILWELTIFVTI